MADYSPIDVTSESWNALTTLTEDVTFQCRAGCVIVTTHSSPSGDNGIILREGEAITISSGQTVRYRKFNAPSGKLIMCAI